MTYSTWSSFCFCTFFSRILIDAAKVSYSSELGNDIKTIKCALCDINYIQQNPNLTQTQIELLLKNCDHFSLVQSSAEYYPNSDFIICKEILVFLKYLENEDKVRNKWPFILLWCSVSLQISQIFCEGTLQERFTFLYCLSYVMASDSFLFNLGKYRDIIVNDLVFLMIEYDGPNLCNFSDHVSTPNDKMFFFDCFWNYLECWPQKIHIEIKGKVFNQLCERISIDEEVIDFKLEF